MKLILTVNVLAFTALSCKATQGTSQLSDKRYVQIDEDGGRTRVFQLAGHRDSKTICMRECNELVTKSVPCHGKVMTASEDRFVQALGKPNGLGKKTLDDLPLNEELLSLDTTPERLRPILETQNKTLRTIKITLDQIYDGKSLKVTAEMNEFNAVKSLFENKPSDPVSSHESRIYQFSYKNAKIHSKRIGRWLELGGGHSITLLAIPTPTNRVVTLEKWLGKKYAFFHNGERIASIKESSLAYAVNRGYLTPLDNPSVEHAQKCNFYKP